MTQISLRLRLVPQNRMYFCSVPLNWISYSLRGREDNCSLLPHSRERPFLQQSVWYRVLIPVVLATLPHGLVFWLSDSALSFNFLLSKTELIKITLSTYKSVLKSSMYNLLISGLFWSCKVENKYVFQIQTLRLKRVAVIILHNRYI